MRINDVEEVHELRTGDTYKNQSGIKMLSPSLLSSRELSSTNRRPSVLTGVIRNEIICVVILHHGYIPIIKIIFLYITG